MTGSIEDPSGIQDLLLFRLSKIVSIGGSMVTRICEGQFGITRREWAVLAMVAQADEMPWSRIVEQSELDDARLSRAVSSLVAKGLASKRRIPSRGVWVSLTDAGRSVFAALFPVTRSVNLRLLEALDEAGRKQLDRALDAIHHRAVALAEQTDLPNADRRRGKA
ncbi:MarR family winged helix-turn-helix transcriptional regulator [Aquabacterium sp.]|uniref:MarR family winged helix-turn-helix transcriptional regulator n=1 Tax=Aquabacterium sp. TaxID=1872578 RepID=UPI0037840F1D